MHRSPLRLRAQALVLLLTLLAGAFGLPLLDAVMFHSTARASATAAPDRLQAGHLTGMAHGLGCAIWTGAASGTGLPGPTPGRATLATRSAECPPTPPFVLSSQTDLSLRHSRAPPSA
jgi:hypothetical protein